MNDNEFKEAVRKFYKKNNIRFISPERCEEPVVSYIPCEICGSQDNARRYWFTGLTMGFKPVRYLGCEDCEAYIEFGILPSER